MPEFGAQTIGPKRDRRSHRLSRWPQTIWAGSTRLPCVIWLPPARSRPPRWRRARLRASRPQTRCLTPSWCRCPTLGARSPPIPRCHAGRFTECRLCSKMSAHAWPAYRYTWATGCCGRWTGGRLPTPSWAPASAPPASSPSARRRCLSSAANRPLNRSPSARAETRGTRSAPLRDQAAVRPPPSRPGWCRWRTPATSAARSGCRPRGAGSSG